MKPPNPSGLCQCGCGARTPLAKQTHRGKGYVKGEPVRFLPLHHHHLREPAEGYRIDENDCWVWTLGLSPDGYACHGTGKRAHRIFWERANGPVPAGLHLDHLCRNRACVNPSHLEPVTPAENSRRGMWFGGLTDGRGDGRRLRAARVQRDLSQVELARLVDCSTGLISQWENGRTPSSLEIRSRISTALAVAL